MDVEMVAEIFIRSFHRQHDLPTIIVSDQTRQFMNILWKKNIQNSRYQRKLSTVYHL